MDKKIEAKGQIKKLIQRFGENISQYKRRDYDEANTRADFIDPFFESLGWDVANKQGYAEQYREVVREAKVIITGKHKAPDYSFRIGGIRKFFVEAKRPSIVLKSEVSPAYQLRRYAYTAKLPLSILTDFEEFSVYDTRIKPTAKDLASCVRIFYCGYKDYLENFDFIYDTFSKEGILIGSFDRYIESTKNKRGTSEVDKEFLKLIDRWREKLAKNIALRNKSLSLYELNFAVQKIVDRIIFLRIAEARQIEDYGKLKILLNGTNTYRRLMEIFLHSDKKYNSGLFDFEKDEITPVLSIDDEIIKEILKSVYYPESPYEFSVLDVEILGNIYEQFLGKTIRLTPAHQVKVEEKPEVKKAGGVYYTPKYIVDYIVKNTVGKIIKGKTPKQIDKIKLLDPACGSGSFLLSAYQCLLNYHLDWYSKNENRKKALKKGQIIQTEKDSFQLTIAEKQRILLNNIFGVDIDTQAVEVSKLSLLLKLLEGETEESTRQLFRYTQLKLLPDLSNNIKCGNSLISPDFYDTQQTTLFDEAEMRRINVFDWKTAFPNIFQNGGFDVVIGNPPYVRSRNIPQNDKTYYMQHFFSASRLLDTYYLFLEKGIKLLRDSGRLSFIIPNGILTNKDSEKIRQFIVENTCIEIIVDLKEGIFKNVAVDTNIIVVQREKSQTIRHNHNFAIGMCLAAQQQQVTTPHNILPQKYLTSQNSFTFNTAIDTQAIALIQKISTVSTKLSNLVKVRNGMKIRKELCSSDYEDNRYHKFLLGRNIVPFHINWNNLWVCYDKKLESKYSSQAFREEWIFQIFPKLLIRQVMGKRIYCSLDQEGFYADQSIYLLLPKTSEVYSPKYLLGILTSSLIAFYFLKTSSDTKQTFPKIKGYQIEQLPIHTIDFSNPHEKKMHDDLVAMVEQMLELQKKYHSARLEQDKKLYKTQIDLLDQQIDSLAYKLYGLTEEEIKIIER